MLNPIMGHATTATLAALTISALPSRVHSARGTVTNAGRRYAAWGT
jgi:hypothetical protein